MDGNYPHVLVDGTWVDLLYPGSDLKHSRGWYVDDKPAVGGSVPSPSGPLRAEVTLTAPSNLQASWMLPGKSFQIYSHTGGLIWGGLTVEPGRGDGEITIYGEGIGAKLSDRRAVYDADTGAGVDIQPSFIPNDAVDYAAANGAPFYRQSGVDLGSTSVQLDNDGTFVDILTLLQRAAISQGKRVYVDSRGAITYRDDPTTPTWMMPPQSDYFGTTDEQFVSRLWGYYLNADKFAYILEITGSPTGGTFKLTGNAGQTFTATIAYNVSTATLETRVQSLGGVWAVAHVIALATNRWMIEVEDPAPLGVDATGLTGGTNPAVSIKPSPRRSIVKWEDAVAADKFGDKEASIDLTGLDAMAESAAQAYIDGRGALVGGRMGWTVQLELNDTNLLNSNGVWGNPRYVKAGDMLQVPGIIDARSCPTTRGSILIVVQEVEITEGPKPTALVTPVGFVARDFDGILAPPENPSAKEAA